MRPAVYRSQIEYNHLEAGFLFGSVMILLVGKRLWSSLRRYCGSRVPRHDLRARAFGIVWSKAAVADIPFARFAPFPGLVFTSHGFGTGSAGYSFLTAMTLVGVVVMTVTFVVLLLFEVYRSFKLAAIHDAARQADVDAVERMMMQKAVLEARQRRAAAARGSKRRGEVPSDAVDDAADDVVHGNPLYARNVDDSERVRTGPRTGVATVPSRLLQSTARSSKAARGGQPVSFSKSPLSSSGGVASGVPPPPPPPPPSRGDSRRSVVVAAMRAARPAKGAGNGALRAGAGADMKVAPDRVHNGDGTQKPRDGDGSSSSE